MQPILGIFSLGGGEIIIIFFSMCVMGGFVVLIGAIVFLVTRQQKKTAAAQPPVLPPPAPPSAPLAQCPKCGARLPIGAPEGLCPTCLMKQGLGTESGVSGAPPLLTDLARLFPQLEILEPIGKGGMGAVYKARQIQLDRLVALKIIAPRPGSDADFTGRFTREARALAKLNHPNIVAVYDFGQVTELSYFIMEYVDGSNLRQVEQAGKLAPREALEIIPQICAALQFAHDRGIVHRDIKPENVLLDREGHVKIADFGLAKILGQDTEYLRLTGARDVVGTPHYMAPEQVEKPQEVDHRADIYSLGVVFYEMLTGELPLGKFQPPSQKAQTDVRLDEVVMRSLAKEPERRYQQANQVTTELATIAASPSPQALKQGSVAAKNKSLWIGLGVAAACIVAVLVMLVVMFVLAHVGFASVRNRARESALTAQGWELLQHGRPAEATPLFVEATQLKPDDANAWNGLGWSYFNAGRNTEAVMVFNNALKYEPNHPGALNGLGQIYLSEQKYDDAEKYLLRAAPEAPAACYGLARLYLLEGKFDQAQQYAQKVVDSGQADDTARQMLEAAKSGKLDDTLRATIQPK